MDLCGRPQYSFGLEIRVLGVLKDPAAVTALVGALEDVEPRVRNAAIEALGNIGKGARESAPSLIRLAKDKNSDSRRFSIEALGTIDPDPKEAVPVLLEALEDREAIRGVAARALGRLGPGAASAAEALEEESRSDPSDEVRVRAACALALILAAGSSFADHGRNS